MPIYLHDDNLHTKNVILGAGSISNISKLVHFRRVNFLWKHHKRPNYISSLQILYRHVVHVSLFPQVYVLERTFQWESYLHFGSNEEARDANEL